MCAANSSISGQTARQSQSVNTHVSQVQGISVLNLTENLRKKVSKCSAPSIPCECCNSLHAVTDNARSGTHIIAHADNHLSIGVVLRRRQNRVSDMTSSVHTYRHVYTHDINRLLLAIYVTHAHVKRACSWSKHRRLNRETELEYNIVQGNADNEQ